MLIARFEVMSTCHPILRKLLMRLTVVSSPLADVSIAATSRVPHLTDML